MTGRIISRLQHWIESEKDENQKGTEKRQREQRYLRDVLVDVIIVYSD